MAIYHSTFKAFSRAKGQTSVAAAAYRAGVKFKDERTGVVHNYENRRGVISAKILAPAGVPDWVHVPGELWNRVEAHEVRRNSCVARELEVALPHELDDGARQRLAHELAQVLVDRYQVAVLAAVHEPSAKGDERNHHVHLLFTTRTVNADGFGAKVRVLHDVHTAKDEVRAIRAAVAALINQHLAAAGIAASVDHRSLVQQAAVAADRGQVQAVAGLCRLPQEHEGKTAVALVRSGRWSYRRAENLRVREDNRHLATHARHVVASLRRTTVPVRWRGSSDGTSGRSRWRVVKAHTAARRSQQRRMPVGLKYKVQAYRESYIQMLQRTASEYRKAVAHVVRANRLAAREAENLRVRLAHDGQLRQLVWQAYAADREAMRWELAACAHKRGGLEAPGKDSGEAPMPALITAMPSGAPHGDEQSGSEPARIPGPASMPTAPRPDEVVAALPSTHPHLPIDADTSELPPSVPTPRTTPLPRPPVGNSDPTVRPPSVRPKAQPKPPTSPHVPAGSKTALPTRREWAQRRRAQRRAAEAAGAPNTKTPKPPVPEAVLEARARQARDHADRAAADVRTRMESALVGPSPTQTVPPIQDGPGEPLPVSRRSSRSSR